MAGKTKTKTGTVDNLLKGRSPEVRKWVTTVRKLVRATAPGAAERVYLGWRVIMYARNKEMRVKDMFCGIGPLKQGVNLFFHQGAKLPDRLLAGTGKGMRHVKIRAARDIRPAALRKLVRAAYKLAG
ncbi:MAG: DUF1801 domain-containing protein [Terriglobia bacterium]